MDAPETFLLQIIIPTSLSLLGFGIRSGHVCQCDATAGRRNICALCELCQGCGPGRYGLDAISSSALRVPAAAAESRETSAVAQVAHSTATGLLAGVHLHVPDGNLCKVTYN